MNSIQTAELNITSDVERVFHYLLISHLILGPSVSTAAVVFVVVVILGLR